MYKQGSLALCSGPERWLSHHQYFATLTSLQHLWETAWDQRGVRLEPGLQPSPLRLLQSSCCLLSLWLSSLFSWRTLVLDHSLPFHIPLSHVRWCLLQPLLLLPTPESGHHWHVATSETLNPSIVLWPQSSFCFTYLGTSRRPQVLWHFHFLYLVSMAPTVSLLDFTVLDFNWLLPSVTMPWPLCPIPEQTTPPPSPQFWILH